MSEGKTFNRSRFDGVNFYPSPEKDLFSLAGGTDENGISDGHRQYRDEFKKLLGPLVPALLRDCCGSLDVSKIRVQDFSEFKKFLQRQAELNDGKSFRDPYQALLEDEQFEPLLKLLYQEINTDFYVVISVPETEALFKEFQAKLIEIDSDTFVRNQYNSKEGRDNLRHVLGDASAFTQDQRSEVLKSVARAAEEEETLWFGGSHGLKLSDHISLLNYFNWGVGDQDLSNATGIAKEYLDAADARDVERAVQEEEYSKNPGQVAGARYLKQALGYTISEDQIQAMAHLAKAGVKDTDPKRQVQGHLAELWLVAVDTRRFGKNTGEAYGINAYIVEKTEKLIEAAQRIESDEDLESFNQELQEFLNGPIADLEKSGARRWLKHQTLGLGLQEQFESYPVETRRPYEALVQFSDKWKYALECGEKILLDSPNKEAVDPKVEEAKNQLIVGLQKTQQELWYGYKQHKAISRGMSQVSDLANPGYHLAKWLAPDQAHHLAIGDYAEIESANRELDKLVEQLQKAGTQEEVEAQIEKLNELIKEGGILYKAFQAAEMDGIEQTLGLVQTVAILLGTAQVTRGASLAVEGAEAAFLADKMLRGFFWGAYMATAENAVAVSTGEVRTERDTIGNWTKDAASTGASMALVMPAAGSVGQALEGNVLKNLAARYLNPGGLTRLAGDTGLETLEEAVDQQLRKTLDGKGNALSSSELQELFKLCLAGGGFQIGTVAKNFRGQVEASEKVAEEKASALRRNPLLNPLFAPMWMLQGIGIGGFGKGDSDGSQGRLVEAFANADRLKKKYDDNSQEELSALIDIAEQLIPEDRLTLFHRLEDLWQKYDYNCPETLRKALVSVGRLLEPSEQMVIVSRFAKVEEGQGFYFLKQFIQHLDPQSRSVVAVKIGEQVDETPAMALDALAKILPSLDPADRFSTAIKILESISHPNTAVRMCAYGALKEVRFYLSTKELLKIARKIEAHLDAAKVRPNVKEDIHQTTDTCLAVKVLREILPLLESGDRMDRALKMLESLDLTIPQMTLTILMDLSDALPDLDLKTHRFLAYGLAKRLASGVLTAETNSMQSLLEELHPTALLAVIEQAVEERGTENLPLSVKPFIEALFGISRTETDQQASASFLEDGIEFEISGVSNRSPSPALTSYRLDQSKEFLIGLFTNPPDFLEARIRKQGKVSSDLLTQALRALLKLGRSGEAAPTSVKVTLDKTGVEGFLGGHVQFGRILVDGVLEGMLSLREGEYQGKKALVFDVSERLNLGREAILLELEKHLSRIAGQKGYDYLLFAGGGGEHGSRKVWVKAVPSDGGTSSGGGDGALGVLLTAGAGLATLLGASEAQAAVKAFFPDAASGGFWPLVAGLLVAGLAAAAGVLGMVRLVHAKKSLLKRPGPAESLEGQAIQANKINTATLLDSFGVDPEVGSPRVPLKMSLSRNPADDVYLSDHLSTARMEGATRVFEDLFQEKSAAGKFPLRHLYPHDSARLIPATNNDWSIAHLGETAFVLNKVTPEAEKYVRFQKGVSESLPFLTVNEGSREKRSKFQATQVVNFFEPGIPQTKTYVFAWIGDRAITAICPQLGLPIQGRENLLRSLAEFISESGLYTSEELGGPLQNQTDTRDGALYREFKAKEFGTEEDSFYRVWHSPSGLGILVHEMDTYEKDHVVRVILEQAGIERFAGAMPLGPAWMNFLNPFLSGEWR